VSVTDAAISRIDPELNKLCPELNEVDLTRNGWEDWNIVEELGAQVPKLSILTLSGNFLRHLQEPLSLHNLQNLTILVLNRTKLDWKTVQNLEGGMHRLMELHLCLNDLKSLDVAEGFQQLKVLNLDGNKFDDWNEVLKISRLPKLEKLMVSDNLLTSIKCKVPEGEEIFPSLKSLSLQGNKIESWHSFDQLNFIQNLETLRCSSNPLFVNLGQSTSRQFVIARVHRLTNLNGSAPGEDSRTY